MMMLIYTDHLQWCHNWLYWLYNMWTLLCNITTDADVSLLHYVTWPVQHPLQYHDRCWHCITTDAGVTAGFSMLHNMFSLCCNNKKKHQQHYLSQWQLNPVWYRCHTWPQKTVWWTLACLVRPQNHNFMTFTAAKTMMLITHTVLDLLPSCHNYLSSLRSLTCNITPALSGSWQQ